MKYLGYLHYVTEIFINEDQSFQCIPNPRAQNKKMIEALEIKLPKFLQKNCGY